MVPKIVITLKNGEVLNIIADSKVEIVVVEYPNADYNEPPYISNNGKVCSMYKKNVIKEESIVSYYQS